MNAPTKLFVPAVVLLCLALTACGGAPTPDVEATQQAVAAATQAAQPTDTLAPPTHTPLPPTDTPVPPTDTPALPTDTPVPPTNTPAPPTDTPAPTDTPVPQDTPTPTLLPPTPTPAVSPAEVHVVAGFDYLDGQRWDEAIAEFQEAIRLDPKFGPAYLGLGYGYALGPRDLAKAIEALETYLRLVPDADDRAQVEADIQEMRQAMPSQPSVSVPPGKGGLIMYNCRGGDVITVDVIPAGILQELAPKTGEDCQPGEPIFLDPGDYVLRASIAGVPSQGESPITIVAGNVSEFTWY
jgi:tetratricopeptide (TPR) repeat protein